MSVCVLFISDGRPYATPTLLSVLERVDFQMPVEVVHVDDREHKLGFAGAIQEGWSRVCDTDAEYVFHLEQDFVITRPLMVGAMAATLERNPHIAQLALRRQPVGNEPAEGGFMAQRPGTYSEHSDSFATWVEHANFFTTNVSLYRSDLCAVGWPDAPDSEGYFGFALREDAGLPWGVAPEDVRFGFWGGMEDGENWIEHIGEERAGIGY